MVEADVSIGRKGPQRHLRVLIWLLDACHRLPRGSLMEARGCVVLFLLLQQPHAKRTVLPLVVLVGLGGRHDQLLPLLFAIRLLPTKLVLPAQDPLLFFKRRFACSVGLLAALPEPILVRRELQLRVTAMLHVADLAAFHLLDLGDGGLGVLHLFAKGFECLW